MATGESLYFIKWQWREKKKNRWCWACQEIAQFHCYPLGQRTVQAYRYPWCEVRRVPVHLLEVQDRGRAQLPAPSSALQLYHAAQHCQASTTRRAALPDSGISQTGDSRQPKPTARLMLECTRAAAMAWPCRNKKLPTSRVGLTALLAPGEMSSQRCTCLILISWCFEKELFKYFAGSSSAGVKTCSLSKVAGR